MTLLISGRLGRALLIADRECWLYDVDCSEGKPRLVPTSTAAQLLILDPLARLTECEQQPDDSAVHANLSNSWHRLQSIRLAEIALQDTYNTQIRKRGAALLEELLAKEPNVGQVLQSSLIAHFPRSSWSYPNWIPNEFLHQLRILHLLNWAGRALREEIERRWQEDPVLSHDRRLVTDLLIEVGAFNAMVQAIAMNDDCIYSSWLMGTYKTYPELSVKKPIGIFLDDLWRNLSQRRSSLTVSNEMLALIPPTVSVQELGLLEGTLPQLKSVLIAAHRVDIPRDELLLGVERNFRRGVRYAFLISKSTAEEEEQRYYRIFQSVELITRRGSIDDSPLTELHKLNFDWREKPLIFYTFLAADQTEVTIALQGDQQRQGIAEHYNVLSTERAQTQYGMATNGAPSSLSVRAQRFFPSISRKDEQVGLNRVQ